MTRQTYRLQSLQVFRGAATILVLFFHATGISRVYLDYDLLGGTFLFGYSGVDFFFVLSGFIIFLVHCGDLECPEQLKPFLKKRLIRIYPFYWIVALLLLPIYFGAPHSVGDHIVLLKSFLLVPQATNPVVTAAWSLTHELFFYGMFGLAIYCSRRYLRYLFIGWLLITSLFYLGRLLTAGALRLPPHTGFVFSSYNLEFAMGCAAAYLLNYPFPISSSRSLALTGAALFLVCGLNEPSLYAHFGHRHAILCYGFPSMLIIWGTVLWERQRTFAMPSLLLLLGDASYSIYLTHYALLDISAKGLLAANLPATLGPALTMGIIMTFSLGVGVLSYLYVERPLLAYLRKRNNVNTQSPDRPMQHCAGA